MTALQRLQEAAQLREPGEPGLDGAVEEFEAAWTARPGMESAIRVKRERVWRLGLSMDAYLVALGAFRRQR